MQKTPMPPLWGLLLIFCLLSLINSCKKIDEKIHGPAGPVTSNTSKVEKFLLFPADVHPSVKKIAEFIDRENQRSGFLNKFIKAEGFAVWNKALVNFGKPNQILTKGNDSTLSDEVLVPLVYADSNAVHAALACRVTNDSVYINLLDGRFYNQYNADSTNKGLNGKQLSLTLMLLDKEVFGHTLFEIKDSAAFATTAGKYVKYVRLSGADQGQPNIAGKMVVYTVRICYTSYESEDEGQLVGCGPGEPCNQYNEVTTCLNFSGYYDDGEYESGGGADGGTGGNTGSPNTDGGGSGWTTPPLPPCPPGTTEVARPDPNNDPSPCSDAGTGWVPVNPPQPPITPTDSLLRIQAILVNKYRDSLAGLCESQHKERFFNIVIQNNQIDTFRVITSASDAEVKPNYYMAGGRIAIGSWHYHPKYTDGTPGSWPSGGDVAQLYDKPKGFVMIIDTYTARYALVVEDVGKMNTWKNIPGNGPTKFPEKVNKAVLSDPRVYSTGDAYITMTKDKLLEALGNSANCGIELYQASSANGTTFSKIN